MELAVVNWLAISRDEAVDERMDVGREDCAVLKIQRQELSRENCSTS
jgi:hypothetical protein